MPLSLYGASVVRGSRTEAFSTAFPVANAWPKLNAVQPSGRQKFTYFENKSSLVWITEDKDGTKVNFTTFLLS